MITKTFVGAGHEGARVTFTLPSSTWANSLHLVGDFNDWDSGSHPFQQDRDGTWSITVDLKVGCAYQFRYLRDGQTWFNDSQADAHVYNAYGSDNFVVVTHPQYKPYRDVTR